MCFNKPAPRDDKIRSFEIDSRGGLFYTFVHVHSLSLFKKAPAARAILEFVPRNLIRQKSIVSRCGACPCHSLVPGVNCPVIWRCMAGMALLVSVVPDNKKINFARIHTNTLARSGQCMRSVTSDAAVRRAVTQTQTQLVSRSA